MRINSYARAFPCDRRIYRVDRWTIPIPGGLPLAASAWFVGLAVLTITLAQIPGLRQVVNAAGWPATVLIGPGALSIALTRPSTEGRTVPAHALCAMRWHVNQLTSRLRTGRAGMTSTRSLRVACDPSMGRGVRIHGPGRVALDGILNVEQRAERLLVTTGVEHGPPYLIQLSAQQILEVAR